MKTNAMSIVVIAVMLFSSCSKIEENNDPILGVWSKTKVTANSDNLEVNILEEWIFNDVYMGRYHIYENDQLVFHHDYDWEVNNDCIYTITFRGNVDLEGHVVILKNDGKEVLEYRSGEVFAER